MRLVKAKGSNETQLRRQLLGQSASSSVSCNQIAPTASSSSTAKRKDNPVRQPTERKQMIKLHHESRTELEKNIKSMQEVTNATEDVCKKFLNENGNNVQAALGSYLYYGQS